jgi:hypothetical protein
MFDSGIEGLGRRILSEPLLGAPAADERVERGQGQSHVGGDGVVLKCLYVGGESQYQEYQKLRLQRDLTAREAADDACSSHRGTVALVAMMLNAHRYFSTIGTPAMNALSAGSA